MSSFYTCEPKIKIKQCTVPEIQKEIDLISCHFGPFFAILPPKKLLKWTNK